MTKIATCKKVVNPETLIITFQFATGQTLMADLDRLDAGIIQKLALHGLSQKIGDSYAGKEVGEAFDLASAVYDGLLAGDWNTGNKGNGGILAEALAMKTGKDLEECQSVVKGLDDKMKKELAKALAVELSKLKLAKAEKVAAADTDAIDLGGLFQ